MKKRTTITEQAREQIAVAYKKVQSKISKLAPHPFGHAYLWGTVEVTLKNGNSRYYKACLGGICTADLEKAVELANSVDKVSNVYYNLD